jgi:putative membrane protein
MKTVCLFILSVTFFSCREKHESTIPDENYNHSTGNDQYLKRDADFLSDAAKINLEEIKLARLAQENSIRPEIRNIAKDFESTHLRLTSELNNIAEKKSIRISIRKENTIDPKLKNEIGDDFESLYFSKIVNDYKYAVQRFESAAHNSSDEEVRLWAKSTVPVLRKNLGVATTLQANAAAKKNLK